MEEDKGSHFAHVAIGYDFGMVTHLGYNYSDHLKKPIIFTLDYSMPMGENIFDDYKFRLGGEVQLFDFNNFISSLKFFGVLNRHQTELVRITNLGTETSALIGYHRPKWHIAVEFGFLNLVLSNLRHSEIMKTNYPFGKEGWYNSSGGYYFYGLQGSKTIAKKINLSFKIGATNAQGNHKEALLPYYTKLGLIKKI